MIGQLQFNLTTDMAVLKSETVLEAPRFTLTVRPVRRTAPIVSALWKGVGSHAWVHAWCACRSGVGPGGGSTMRPTLCPLVRYL